MKFFSVYYNIVKLASWEKYLKRVFENFSKNSRVLYPYLFIYMLPRKAEAAIVNGAIKDVPLKAADDTINPPPRRYISHLVFSSKVTCFVSSSGLQCHEIYSAASKDRPLIFLNIPSL